MVVFEMACQLQAAGERTALAVMINNYAPLENKTRYRVQKELQDFMKLSLQGKLDYAIRKNINLGRRIRNKARNVLQKASGQTVTTDPERDDIRFIHSLALIQYDPKHVFEGDVFVVRAGGPVEDPEYYDETLGWKRLVKGQIRLAQVEGSNNDTIVERTEYNSRLAALIREQLESEKS
jgi:thioesterase domain-containing protein